MSQIAHCIAAAVQMIASSDSKSLRVGGVLFPRSQASRGMMRAHGRHVPGMMIASWKRPDWARAVRRLSWALVADILTGGLQGDGLHRSHRDGYPMVLHGQLRDGVLRLEHQEQVTQY